MYRVLLYTGESCVSTYLADDQKRSVDISLEMRHDNHSKVVNIRLYAIEDQWYIERPNGFLWDEDNQDPINRAITSKLDISATDSDGWHFGVLCRECLSKDTLMQKYCITDRITIGKSGCDIELNDQYISDQHGEILKNAASGYY